MSVQQVVTQKLREALDVAHLDVINESFMHNVPAGAETHFKVTLVSDDFKGKKQVVRHQIVYALLADEMAGPVHALALHIYTEDEWQQRAAAPDSPACLGGRRAS
jgi:BolA protein